MSDSIERLNEFLHLRHQSGGIIPLTADASTREYFRIEWNGGHAVACVYPESFDPREQNYLDATRLFLAADLPVAEIYDNDGPLGIVIQEDLGNEILRDVMGKADEERRSLLLSEAIALIARIQRATDVANATNSIASMLSFDQEKLLWELEFFKSSYFVTYLGRPLPKNQSAQLSSEFADLATILEGYARVLCHRDFHAANLMLDERGRMRIIDHQDARIGSAAYDLVSLLLDRITEIPSPEFLAEKRRYFLDVRRTLGMPNIDEAEFACEFRLQTLQRCLKAVGTFSFQSATRGKTHFIGFIEPMLRIVQRSAGNLDGFPAIKEMLDEQINGNQLAPLTP